MMQVLHLSWHLREVLRGLIEEVVLNVYGHNLRTTSEGFYNIYTEFSSCFPSYNLFIFIFTPQMFHVFFNLLLLLSRFPTLVQKLFVFNVFLWFSCGSERQTPPQKINHLVPNKA